MSEEEIVKEVIGNQEMAGYNGNPDAYVAARAKVDPNSDHLDVWIAALQFERGHPDSMANFAYQNFLRQLVAKDAYIAHLESIIE